MIYPRRAARWLLLSGAVNPWTGATWAMDGNGRAYNTPTIGGELLTNGGFESSFSAGLGSGWTKNGTPTTTQEGTTIRSGANSQKVVSTANLHGIFQYLALPVGTWFMAQIFTWVETGVTRAAITTNGGSTDILRVTATLPTWTEGLAVGRSSGTGQTGFFIRQDGATATTFYVDDGTLETVTFPTTLATIAGSTSNKTAAAKIYALTAGTPAGVVSLLDSASNPQNFLIAYHDGTNVKLDKCVAGTYTSLVSTAVAFSSGAQIEIRRPSGNTFQLWYNGSQRGTNQTVSDAGIISNTIYGLFSTYSGNTFSEFSLDSTTIPLVFPGATPTFAPPLLADLWAWFDASDIATLYQNSTRTTAVTTNGDPVGSWGDKSINARNASQAGASTLKPTYQTAVQNGLAGLLYDGGDYIDTAATLPSIPVTVVGVFRSSATIGTARGLVSNRNSTTFGARVSFTSSNTVQAQIDTPLALATAPTTVGASTTVIAGYRANTSQITVIQNGTLTTTSHTAAAVTNIVGLGRINVNTAGTLANGHLMEVVIYNRALSDDELAQVQTYLNTKWAVY